LRDDVPGHFRPWEALPYGERDGNGRVEVPTGDRRASHDGKSDTKGESDCNGEQRTEAGIRAVDRERSYRSNTREDVEEDACGFSGHLTEPSWACVLEGELTLGDRLLSDDLAADVSLNRFRHTDLELVRV